MDKTLQIESLSVVSYRSLENGLHEIVPHESSRQSVEQIFTLIDQIFASIPPGQTVRYIIADYENIGMLPITHVARLGRAWLQKNPHHAPSRSLFLYHSSILLSTGVTMLNILQRSSRSQWKWRFVEIKNLEQGMQWLLADD
ncbi:MAG: hypothetical protein H7X77_08350 [Anaerolineae bacterium]|nr:hypothetical protein [Anaerolineae bacterium]